ncbi:MAG TPA: ribbon-helix-helix protein, CopG family [Myxococcaceae bacterium]|nr:ribbon-helix-helix protein, CopG family [Myxococcaceae bacterium]
MVVTIRLKAKSERLIRQIARKRGKTKSAVIREALDALFEQEASSTSARRPYGALAHLLGCARGGPSDLSIRSGERFKHLLHQARGETG